jgi:hypothetical protein
MVSVDKLGSWFLLLIISYTLVSLINAPRTMVAKMGKGDPHPAGGVQLTLPHRNGRVQSSIRSSVQPNPAGISRAVAGALPVRGAGAGVSAASPSEAIT